MPESYSLFPYFLENHGRILFLVSLFFVALLDPFDPNSPFKFLIFINLVIYIGSHLYLPTLLCSSLPCTIYIYLCKLLVLLYSYTPLNKGIPYHCVASLGCSTNLGQACSEKVFRLDVCILCNDSHKHSVGVRGY